MVIVNIVERMAAARSLRQPQERGRRRNVSPNGAGEKKKVGGKRGTW